MNQHSRAMSVRYRRSASAVCFRQEFFIVIQPLYVHPELSFQEEKTAQFVYETLQSFGHLELSRPTKTS
ncbi:amidohydrolase, partial [Anoxybacillus geothermalis]|nr:amidohydrolase [Anoxybacillus geothermalis]